MEMAAAIPVAVFRQQHPHPSPSSPTPWEPYYPAPSHRPHPLKSAQVHLPFFSHLFFIAMCFIWYPWISATFSSCELSVFLWGCICRHSAAVLFNGDTVHYCSLRIVSSLVFCWCDIHSCKVRITWWYCQQCPWTCFLLLLLMLCVHSQSSTQEFYFIFLVILYLVRFGLFCVLSQASEDVDHSQCSKDADRTYFWKSKARLSPIARKNSEQQKYSKVLGFITAILRHACSYYHSHCHCHF